MALPGVAVRAASLLWLIAFWALLAELNANPRVLPGAMDVAPRIWAELVSGELLRHIGATLLCVVAAFTVAIGVVLGLVMGRASQSIGGSTPSSWSSSTCRRWASSCSATSGSG